MASTSPQYFTDDPSDDDDFPSVSEMLRRPLVTHRPVEVIGLTQDSSDKRTRTPSPCDTYSPSASPLPLTTPTQWSASSTTSRTTSEAIEVDLYSDAQLSLGPAATMFPLSPAQPSDGGIFGEPHLVTPRVAPLLENWSPFKNIPAWSPLRRDHGIPDTALDVAISPVLPRVSRNDKGDANKTLILSRLASPDELDYTGGPHGTRKRKMTMLTESDPSADSLVSNAFWKNRNDGGRGSLSRRPRARIAPLATQIGHQACTEPPEETFHSDCDRNRIFVERQRKLVGNGNVGRDRPSLEGGWQVDRIVSESQSGLSFEVIVTKTVSLPKAEVGRRLLRRYRAEQRHALPIRRSVRLQA